MRRISNAIRERDDLPDTVSHETVGQMLRGDGTPGWAKFESVVRYLAGVAVHRPDVEAEVGRVQQLWLAVGDATAASTPAADPDDAVARPTAVTDLAPATALFGDVPPRNARFVGREHLIRTIHEILRTGARILTLNGIGGVGKSQLAIEYVRRFRDDYDLVWWVPAEQSSLLRASLDRLGTRLNLPRSLAMQHPPTQVLEALASSEMRWLLVFDNAGRPASLPPLTVRGSGRVLLTSRDPDWARYGSHLEVGVFERGESLRRLRDQTGIAEDDANRLAELLGDLPLAVEQVATWHVANGVPVASYLDEINQQLRKILSDDRSKAANYPVTVSAFLNVAFARLAEAAPTAAQLLELFAWVSAEPLSLTLLRGGRQGAVTSPLREALRHAPTLDSAVRDLRRHGLVTVIDGDPVRVRVHRVFQRALRDWLGETRLARGRANVQAILAAANPGEPDDPRCWPHYAEVSPHVGAADLANAEDFEARRVVLDHVRYLHRIGHHAESRAWGERLAALGARGTMDADHHFYVRVRQQLGNTLRILGDYTAAREATLDAINYLENHPEFPQADYLTDLDNNRAADLRIAGAYAEALTVDEASLRSQLLNDADDWNTIGRMRNNIAVNYRLLGRFAEAHEIDAENVQQWTDTRGAHDPRTLFARSNLARDLFGLGRFSDALREVRSFLPGYRTVVGAHHHGVLWAVRTEVMALRKLGEIGAALRLAEENRRDVGTWFGPRHEYTLAADISLVNAQLAAGDLGAATVAMPELLNGCEQLFGREHPMRLAVLVNSAAVMRALGDLGGAHRCDEQATAELKRVLGADHPYTLCANHNLAVDLLLLGHQDQALDEARSVLARSRATRGENHPDTLATAVNIALATGGLSRVPDAWQALLGANHPQVLSARRGQWVECDIEPPPT
jgi:tetratricopeptide (TPR) repeat protein